MQCFDSYILGGLSLPSELKRRRKKPKRKVLSECKRKKRNRENKKVETEFKEKKKQKRKNCCNIYGWLKNLSADNNSENMEILHFETSENILPI